MEKQKKNNEKQNDKFVNSIRWQAQSLPIWLRPWSFSNIEFDRNIYNYDSFPNEPQVTNEEIKAWDIAPGVGIGRKWVNKKGWTFEYMIGVGRYLFSSSENDDIPDGASVSDYRPEATFKGGISIGKRF